LVGVPGMTLAEVPLLLTDADFRRRLIGRVDDPIALGPFWAAYEAWSDAERAQAIGPVMNKLRAFLLRRRLRHVLGQAEPHQDLGQLPSEMQKAVLANARSRVIFQVSAGDAGILARELAPHLTAEDLQGLAAYEVAATLSAGARIAPPVTARTLLPPEPTG